MTNSEKISKLENELQHHKEINDELELILDTTFDLISVADGSGIFLRINKGSEKIFNVSESEIIGSSAYEVEKKGIIDRSVTAIVLETKKKHSAIQTTKTGKRFMVIGIPMFDNEGNLKRIINISRDITEIEKLNNRLRETEELLDWYRHEVRKKQEIEDKFISSKTPSMKKIITLINQISNVDATVLLQGETGVGKNIIAKTIHQISHRRNEPFIQINCGAIPENLLESELFGYEEGAFTGAKKAGKKGFFEIANKGTLFLDEIGEIPMHLQVKLLHALEHSEIYKVGSSNPTKIDVRILAATNKNLKEMVEKIQFREDLYYRLNVLPILIPPLRERKEDIPLLSHFFLRKYNKKYCMNKQFTSDTYNALSSYSWPGNIRELENTIERLIITCDGDNITESDANSMLQGLNNKTTVDIDEIMPIKEAVAKVETELLTKAIKKYKTTRKVAKVLGIDQSTVVKKIKKYNINSNLYE